MGDVSWFLYRLGESSSEFIWLKAGRRMVKEWKILKPNLQFVITNLQFKTAKGNKRKLLHNASGNQEQPKAEPGFETHGFKILVLSSYWILN